MPVNLRMLRRMDREINTEAEHPQVEAMVKVPVQGVVLVMVVVPVQVAVAAVGADKVFPAC